MSRSLIITSASIVAFAAFAAIPACSSSSSSSTGGGDSGTTEPDGTGSSSGSSGGSSGSSSGSTADSGSSSGSSSGGSSGGSSGSSSGANDGGGEAGGTCTAAISVTGIPAYTDVAPTQACTGAQIQGAASSCFGSGTGCSTWITSNPSCAACALGNEPDGGLPNPDSAVVCYGPGGQGGCFLNQDACIEIKDGNDTCASADFALNYCLYTACDSATCETDLQNASSNTTDATDFDNCLNSAASVACTTQNSAWTTACGNAMDSADGGSVDSCVAQTTSDVVRILNLICNPGNQ